MEKENTLNESCTNKKMTSIGGMALMEGLMMVGPKRISMAVRKPDKMIHVETTPVGRSSKAAKIPFVRGSVRIFRQMVTGTGYLMKSAQFIDEEEISEDEKASEDMSTEGENKIVQPSVQDNPVEEQEAEKPDSVAKKKKKTGRIEKFLTKHTDILLYFSAILGILLSVGLFILLPNLITNLSLGMVIDRNAGVGPRVLSSLFEGVLRIGIFLGYLALASNLKDIKRVWMYHGAEHKTIACYESKEQLNVDNVKKHSKHHPRCGTAFMFIILIISIILFSFVPRINIFVDLLIRLALVPLLAGISYEIIHWAAKHDNFLTRSLSAPGLFLQRLTTKEPDDSMLEVAIAAMVPVIPYDEKADEW